MHDPLGLARDRVAPKNEVVGAPRTLMELADHRLYRAKRSSRIQVVASDNIATAATAGPSARLC